MPTSFGIMKRLELRHQDLSKDGTGTKCEKKLPGPTEPLWLAVGPTSVAGKDVDWMGGIVVEVETAKSILNPKETNTTHLSGTRERHVLQWLEDVHPTSVVTVGADFNAREGLSEA